MPMQGNVFYYGMNDRGAHIIRIDERTFQIVAVNRDEAIANAIEANQR